MATPHMLYLLAINSPSQFLDEVESGRVRLTPGHFELVLLGEIDDPRAVRLLVACTRSPSWMVRSHAVRGLARRDDADSIAAVERAARRDCSVLVRVEAALGILRRDPARGQGLLRGMLNHPHMTPGLRKQIHYALNLDM